MRTCKSCGHPVNRGWTAGGSGIRYCLVCETARLFGSVLAKPREPCKPRPCPSRPCACGCGRIGPIAGWGLVRRCYRVLSKAGRLGQWKAQHHVQ